MFLRTKNNDILIPLQKIDQYISNINLAYYESKYMCHTLKSNLLKGGSNGGIEESEETDESNKFDDRAQDKLEKPKKRYIQMSIEKYDKIKAFAKLAKKTITHYKSIAEVYYNSYNTIFVYYLYLLELLKKQKSLLEDQQNQYERLSKDFSSNKDKIALLETMIDGVQRVVSKTAKLDLDIKNKVDGKDIDIKAEAKLLSGEPVVVLDKKISLSGGAMTLDQFNNSITHELSELTEHFKSITEDNKFIEKKIEALHEKVKSIVVETDDLMNIRLSIEWLVNQLEIKVPEIIESEKPVEIDYKEINDRLIAAINDIKKMGGSPTIAKYLKELEYIAEYFNKFINSSKSTLIGMDEKKKIEMMEVINKLHSVNEFLGENKKEIQPTIQSETISSKYMNVRDKIRGGGEVINEYNNIISIFNERLNTMFSGENGFVFVGDDGNILEIQKLVDIVNNNSQEKSVMQDRLEQILIMGHKMYKIIQLMNKYVGPTFAFANVKNESSQPSINYEEDWDNVFIHKNTDFYKKLKNAEIFDLQNLSNSSLTYNEQMIKGVDFLKKMNTQESINDERICIKFDKNFLQTNENFNNFIKKLDQSLVFYYHLVFIIMSKVAYIISAAKTEKANELYDLLSTINTDMVKSVSMYGFNSIKDYNDKFQQFGGGVDLLDKFENIGEIDIDDDNIKEKINPDFFNVLYKQFINILTSKEKIPAEKVNEKINENLIKNSFGQTKKIDDLYDKVRFRLGKTYNEDLPSETEENIEFIAGVKKLNDETGKPKLEPELESKTQTQSVDVSESTNKPRIAPYKRELEECTRVLGPINNQLVSLKKARDGYKVKNDIDDDTYTLAQLSNTINTQMAIGINAYIKVIPMIFFTIEFPPYAYEKDKCKMMFKYDKKNEFVYCEKPSNLQGCTIIEKYLEEHPSNTNSNSDYLIGPQPTHQAFLDTLKNDTTKDLMEDQIIGLNNLIRFSSKDNEPTQKTINMMFALGASGTGKTTRYFGKSDARYDGDKKGIVPSIIEFANSENKSGSNTKISLAYFVCYGRKKDIKKVDENDFDEYLIFANVESVNEKIIKNVNRNIKKGDIAKFDAKAIFDEDDFMVYKQNLTPTSDTLNYTNFYTNLVTRKFKQVEFDEGFKDYLINGADLTENINNDDVGNFRNIIENPNPNPNPNVWMDIDNMDGSKMNELFENLIKSQKLLHTILPTKNNMESSRGHTCVLIRIEENGVNRYFPLFDMAGTESTETMTEFLKENGRNLSNMGKFIEFISNLSVNNALADKSGNEVMEFSSLENLVNVSEEAKGYIQSGGKNKYFVKGTSQASIDDYIDKNGKYEEKFNNDMEQNTIGNETLLDKIIAEGYYINHTIGMLIFVAKCIGCSINSKKIDDNDEFDNINGVVVKEIAKFIKYFSGDNYEGEGTRVLLNGLNWNNILASSSIWIQVLFSFLYWNEENENTFSQIMKACMDNTGRDLIKYMGEQFVVENRLNANYKIDDINTFNVWKFLNNPEFNNYNNNSIEEIYKRTTEAIKSVYNKNINNDDFYYNYENDKVQIKPKGAFKTYVESVEKEVIRMKDINDNYGGDELTKLKNENTENEKYIKIYENRFNKNYGFVNFPESIDLQNNIDDINHFIYERYVKEYINENSSDDFILSKIIDSEYGPNDKLSSNDSHTSHKYDGTYKKFLSVINNTKNNTKIEELQEIIFRLISQKLHATLILIKGKNGLININKNSIQRITNERSSSGQSAMNIVRKTNSTILEQKTNLLNTINNLSLTNNELTKLFEHTYINKNQINKIYFADDNILLIGDERIPLISLIKICTKINLCGVSKTEVSKKNLIQTQNQINRVKDARIGSAKMVLMHVVTGQDFKYPMVKETTDLTTTLFDSTELKL